MKLRVPKDPIPIDSAEAFVYWTSGRLERVKGWRSALVTLSGNRKIRRVSAELRAYHDDMRAAAKKLRAAFVTADWTAWDRSRAEFNAALALAGWAYRMQMERERLGAARERIAKARLKKPKALESKGRPTLKQLKKAYQALRAAGEPVRVAQGMMSERTKIPVNTLRRYLKG